MTVRTAFGAFRLAAAALCLVSLIFRFTWGLGSATFTAGNFFAYLTIQSNIVFLLVTIVAGVTALRTAEDPRWLSDVRAGVLSCTVVAGIVFALLIQQAGARSFRIDVPWSDQVLHFWLPAAFLVEWVLAPGRGRARWRVIIAVLAYPLLWGGVTLVRGAIVGWYPYFFLDPAQVSGFGEFALFSGLALALFGGTAAGVIALSRLVPILSSEKERERVEREQGPHRHSARQA